MHGILVIEVVQNGDCNHNIGIFKSRVPLNRSRVANDKSSFTAVAPLGKGDIAWVGIESKIFDVGQTLQNLRRTTSDIDHFIAGSGSAMQTLGLGNRFSGPFAFAAVALPVYLVGSLGLRVIGLPAILTSMFRPRSGGAVRFLLGIYVVIGVVIALTFDFSPEGWTFRYNPISSTFLVQSEYVAWIFAVEVFQAFYQWALRRGMYPAFAAAGIMAITAGLSLPATVQHFLVWRDPDHFFGSGKPFGRELLTYDPQTLAAMGFLRTDAHPGDVVLSADDLIAPILALTRCRVPVGYFSFSLVSQSDYTRRETAEKKFWNDWRIGKVEDGLLQEANVRYIVVSKQAEGIPATIPGSLSKVFENSEFAVFKVNLSS